MTAEQLESFWKYNSVAYNASVNAILEKARLEGEDVHVLAYVGCADNGDGLEVPMEYASPDYTIRLNVSSRAVENYFDTPTKDHLMFSARFKGKRRDIVIPKGRILYIFINDVAVSFQDCFVKKLCEEYEVDRLHAKKDESPKEKIQNEEVDHEDLGQYGDNVVSLFGAKKHG